MFIVLVGGGGPQAPPLDPVDEKVAELLGEKNETVEGIHGCKDLLVRALR